MIYYIYIYACEGLIKCMMKMKQQILISGTMSLTFSMVCYFRLLFINPFFKGITLGKKERLFYVFTSCLYITPVSFSLFYPDAFSIHHLL